MPALHTFWDLNLSDPYQRQRERELMSQIAAGDDQAFRMLSDEHKSALLQMARFWSSAEHADDIVQESLLNAYRYADSYRGEASLRTWLLHLVRNNAFKSRSKESREYDKRKSLVQLGIEAGWGSENPQLIAERAERKALLRAAIDQLEPHEREIITLRDIQGLTTAECATLLGEKIPTIKTKVRRARLRLAALLRTMKIEEAQ